MTVIATAINAAERINLPDWLNAGGKHFFTGGIMPSPDLMHRFRKLRMVEQEWRWWLFFLAIAGLFSRKKDETWGLSHYRLSPA